MNMGADVGQHHGLWGSQSLGSPTERREGAGGKENDPRTNRRELRRDRWSPDGWGAGALPSSGCPWSASSHCGHQRATAAAEQSTGQLRPHGPAAAASALRAAGHGAPGPWGGWGWAQPRARRAEPGAGHRRQLPPAACVGRGRFWGAEQEGGSPWPRVNEAGQTPGRSKGCPERARPGQGPAARERIAERPGQARLPQKRLPPHNHAECGDSSAKGRFPWATSRDPTLLPQDRGPCPKGLPCGGLEAGGWAQKSAPGPCSP